MKGISLTTFYSELKHYYTTFPDMKYLLLGTLSVLILTYLLAIIFIKFTHKEETPYLRSKLGIIYSLLVVIFVLFLLGVYHTKFTSLIVANRLQSLIITTLFLLVISLYLNFKSAIKGVKSKGYIITKVKEGPLSLSNTILKKRMFLNKRKRFAYLLLLPLLLLFINPSSKYLYSIIFDNSPSMEQQIALAQLHLGKTSEKLKDNSIFIVTSFPRCQNDSECEKLSQRLSIDIKSITSKDYNDLVAETQVIEHKSDLMDYLQNGSLTISKCGSPIYEAIWQNFLSSIESVQNVSITKKKLLILSDGEDNLYRADLGFTRPNVCLFEQLKGTISLNEFYDEISLIKYSGNGTENITSSCASMNVLDGSDATSFEKSFLEQLEDIYFDMYFLIIVTILLIIGILSIQNLK